MPSTPTFRVRRQVAALAAMALLAAVAVAACGPDGDAAAFDVTGPCTVDGQRLGAYPHLESLLPGAWEDRQPDNLVSGRTCTPAALGALGAYGITELRFAGATWDTGGSGGFTLAVFEADGLGPERIIEFYADGAKAGGQGASTTTTAPTVGGQQAIRLDVAAPDGSSQVVVAWPAREDGRVVALLAANTGDIRIGELLEAFGGG